ncbi:hypothetical protein AAC387_Pa04g2890 [Persea americana]
MEEGCGWGRKGREREREEDMGLGEMGELGTASERWGGTEAMMSGSFAGDVERGKEATHGRAEMVAQLRADGVERQ